MVEELSLRVCTSRRYRASAIYRGEDPGRRGPPWPFTGERDSEVRRGMTGEVRRGPTGEVRRGMTGEVRRGMTGEVRRGS